MSRYRVAVIGLGRISSTIDDEVVGDPSTMLPYSHTACYRDVPQVEVIAGADPYEEQRQAYRQRWGVEHVYADYLEMLAQEKPHIVSVATSAKPRPAIVKACAEAGVGAIWAEKPMATTLQEADDMVAICREHGTKLAVNCSRHWDAHWNLAHDMIDAGEIGRVLQVNGFGEANISHNGSHLLDLVRYLAGGEVRWVFGEMESDEKAAGDDDLEGNGYLAFDNGARALARMWPCGAASWEFEVLGEKGRFRSLNNGQAFEWWELERASGKPRLVERLFPRPQRLQSPGVRAVQDLVHCLDTGAEPRCSGVDGRAVLEIAIAMRQSHREGGRRVDLPLADRGLGIRSAETLGGELPQALRRR